MMGEHKQSEIAERSDAERESYSSRATNAVADPVKASFRSRSRWLLQVVRVRLRFLLIVIVAGAIVSQWPVIRGVWDRWTWGFSSQQSWGKVSTSNEYFCPMDPGVVSVWPAICPICNMDLVPRKKMDAVLLPEGVVARMQFSPYRIQLAGIKTAVVEPRPLVFEHTLSGVLRRNEDGSLYLEADMPTSLRSFLMEPRSGEVRTLAMPESVPASVRAIDEGDSLLARITLDDSTSLSAGCVVIASVLLPYADAEPVLAVPESAVVHRGDEHLVYVESMPGMFDGVGVEIGRRCGAYYPVTKGLKASQRVASAGAFLIDAETRLNPGMAAGFFGANQNPSKDALPRATPTAPPASTISPSPKKSSLSREDQALADRQKICPVTELPLNSMGGPIPVLVAGRKIFICCQGCEKRLKESPQKYLVRISE